MSGQSPWGGETEKLSSHLRAPKSIAAKVVVVEGPDEGEERSLATPVVVGTEASCQLALADRAVSSQHVRLSESRGLISIEDLESSNGTHVDGTLVQRAEVGLGSLVRIGRTTLSLQAGYSLKRLAPARRDSFGELIGRSVAMREIFAVLERVAESDSSVLIEGESGTGKELAARSIHAASFRSESPFVVLDCGAIPENLVGAELFGYVSGAFTGASAPRPGVFEQADGGTLFLDEIGELPLEHQPNLLRALETGEVRRLGESQFRNVDVRVVAATHRDLVSEVRRGAFRADLMYRMDVVKVRLPPLRHRPDDIPLLTRHLIGERLPEDDVIEGDNLAALQGYAWPGNVRELRNCLRRAVALAEAPLTFATLPIDFGPLALRGSALGFELPGVARHMPYKEAKAHLLQLFDRAYVDTLMDRHATITEAASAAGLSRKHLYEVLRRVGDPRDEG